jgi:hypothetical protein
LVGDAQCQRANVLGLDGKCERPFLSKRTELLACFLDAALSLDPIRRCHARSHNFTILRRSRQKIPGQGPAPWPRRSRLHSIQASVDVRRYGRGPFASSAYFWRSPFAEPDNKRRGRPGSSRPSSRICGAREDGGDCSSFYDGGLRLFLRRRGGCGRPRSSPPAAPRSGSGRPVAWSAPWGRLIGPTPGRKAFCVSARVDGGVDGARGARAARRGSGGGVEAAGSPSPAPSTGTIPGTIPGTAVAVPSPGGAFGGLGAAAVRGFGIPGVDLRRARGRRCGRPRSSAPGRPPGRVRPARSPAALARALSQRARESVRKGHAVLCATALGGCARPRTAPPPARSAPPRRPGPVGRGFGPRGRVRSARRFGQRFPERMPPK